MNMKTNPAWSALYLLLILTLVIAGCTVTFNPDTSQDPLLYILDLENPSVIHEEQVNPGDRLKITWIHSLEHSPWVETFLITDDQSLEMVEVRFKTFGAGMPYDLKDVSVEDHTFVYAVTDKVFTEYEFMCSKEALESITLNGETIFSPEDMDGYHHLKIVVE